MILADQLHESIMIFILFKPTNLHQMIDKFQKKEQILSYYFCMIRYRGTTKKKMMFDLRDLRDLV